MWLKRFTGFLLRNRWRTILLTFLISFIPVIGTVGILIAGLITLRKGYKEGALVTLAATMPALLGLFFFSSFAAIPLNVWGAVGANVVTNILTWMFAGMLGAGMSWSRMVQIAALLGVFAVSVVHLVYPGITAWWGTQLQSAQVFYDTQMANITGGFGKAPMVLSQSEAEVINLAKVFATGFATAVFLVATLFQVAIARWWQGIVFSPGILGEELHNIRLSRLTGILFALSLVFYYLGNGVILDIMPILYALFVVAGLSLIHFLLGQLKKPVVWFWLTMVYLVLLIFWPVAKEFVAMLALCDIWFDIRKRFKTV